MSTLTAIPLAIQPQAAARIAELGMQAEFEQMLRGRPGKLCLTCNGSM